MSALCKVTVTEINDIIIVWNEKKMCDTFLQATYILCPILDKDTLPGTQDSGQQSSKIVNYWWYPYSHSQTHAKVSAAF